MPILFDVNLLARSEVSLSAVVWKNFIELEAPFLAHLDPSHFQNVIIGILAIYIPYSVVFLSEPRAKSDKQKQVYFTSLVLIDEVLRPKRILWLAISGLFFFSFANGEDISSAEKLVVIFLMLFYVLVLIQPFFNILEYATGSKHKFIIAFLKKLSFSKYFTYTNKDTADKMQKSWASIWSEEENIVEEHEFTEIFFSHLNKAATSNKNEEIGNLLEIYLRNINHRNMILIIDQIIPRLLAVHYANWEQVSKGRGEIPREEFRHFLLNMDLCAKILKSTISLSFKPNMMYQMQPPWDSVASHITKIELLYQHSDQDDLLLEYIRRIISFFCNIFFHEIGNSPSAANHLRNFDFPEEWMLTSANYEKNVPRLLHAEFTDWAGKRVSDNVLSDNYAKNVPEITYILFPSIDYSLFSTFLMIYYDNNITSVIKKYRQFIVLNLPKGLISQEQRNNLEFSPENDQTQEQRKETAAVIFKYFDWPQSSMTSESERQDFNKRSEQERAEYIRQHLKSNITITESDEFKKLCQNDSRKEYFRKKIIYFYKVMITELENNPDLL